jgi:hypothetical protein
LIKANKKIEELEYIQRDGATPPAFAYHQNYSKNLEIYESDI